MDIEKPVNLDQNYLDVRSRKHYEEWLDQLGIFNLWEVRWRKNAVVFANIRKVVMRKRGWVDLFFFEKEQDDEHVEIEHVEIEESFNIRRNFLIVRVIEQ